ncbi:MAG: serine hydrolase domain-containing protein [Micropepsaceae bacterium]
MKAFLQAFAIALLCIVTFSAHAADAAKDKPKPAATLEELDKRLVKLFVDSRIPGASVTIIENNQIAFTKGYGYADLKTKTPVTPDTVFRAGSISKSFTSIAIMMLVEEGKLSLDAKLSDLMPELKYENQWESTNPVRLVHLLEHTSGFDDIDFHHYFLVGKDIPLSKAIDLYGPYKSRWKPGTRASYCNAGPVIAGRIIEKVTGQTFPEFMASRLMGPLGMQTAFWTRESQISDHIAKSYKNEDGVEEPFMEILARPSGSLNVTSKDLAKLPLLMLGRGTLDAHTYISQASVERIERPETTDAARAGMKYGYGLGNVAYPGHKTVFYGHDGGIDGFVSKYQYAPGQGFGFVVMANLGKKELFDAADEIQDYLERNLPPLRIDAQPLAAKDLENYAGFYQTVTPRQQKLALIENILSWQTGTAENGELVFNGTRRIHRGNGIFQKEDRAAPNLMFMRAPEGQVYFATIDTARKVPMWEVGAKAAYAIAFALALVLSAIYMLIWIPSAFLGRLAERGGITLRLLPWAAMLSLVVFASFTVFLLSSNDLNLVGQPSTPGWIVYGSTLAVPGFGVLALVRALMGSPDANIFVRCLAWLNGLVVTGFAGYMYAYGWIGMKLWE